MTEAPGFLNASAAARRLGITVKALRLYERHGLLRPRRTAAGWRCYGAAEMQRAGAILAWRRLGFRLAQIAGLLAGDAEAVRRAVAAQEQALEGRRRELAAVLEGLRGLRAEQERAAAPVLAFELPWPWGGERFELGAIGPLTYITGPLGSGKTRFARRLAELLPDADFLGLERLAEGGAAAAAQRLADRRLAARVARALEPLLAAGATASAALLVLLTALEAPTPSPLVIDMLEEGLDQPTQLALIARLRRRGPDARPLFCLTRSSSILDLTAVGADEAILFCPANHSPPLRVAPHPGAAGYEALASCLASPEVRARTAGTIAWRPAAA